MRSTDSLFRPHRMSRLSPVQTVLSTKLGGTIGLQPPPLYHPHHVKANETVRASLPSLAASRSDEESYSHVQPFVSCSAIHCLAAALAAFRLGAFIPRLLRSIADSTLAAAVALARSSLALKPSMSLANAARQPSERSNAGYVSSTPTSLKRSMRSACW